MTTAAKKAAPKKAAAKKAAPKKKATTMAAIAEQNNLFDPNTPVELGITKQGIAALRKKHDPAKIPEDLSDKEQYAFVKSNALALRDVRTALEHKRKELVAGATAWRDKVNGEAGELKGLIEELESPWKTARQEYDDEQARLKREAAEKEERRIADIEAKVDGIRTMTDDLLGADLETLEGVLAEAQAIEVTVDEYMEFTEAASQVLGQTIQSLKVAVDSARQSETMRKQLEEQQEENNRKQARENKFNRCRSLPVDLMDGDLPDMKAGIEELQSIIHDAQNGIPSDFSDAEHHELIAVCENSIQKLGRLVEMKTAEQERIAAEMAEREKAEQEEKAKQEAQEQANIEATKDQADNVLDYLGRLQAVEKPFVDDPYLIEMLNYIERVNTELESKLKSRFNIS